MAEPSSSLQRRVRGVLAARPGPLDTAVFVFPLFAVYQLGILFGGAGRNGADFVTSLLIRLCDWDRGRYGLLLLALVVGYGLLLVALRRSGRFHPRAFAPVLVESSLLALCMGSLILLVIHNVLYFLPGLGPGLGAGETPGFLGILVLSAGAGLHEELIFRAGLLAGITALVSRRAGAGVAFGVALSISSLAFAWAHHLGPGGEAFTTVAFVYRFLAGCYFGIVYWLRGFAVAAWTHALYDVYVLAFA